MWQRIKNIYHYFFALICNILFFFPARKLIVIGVTGTDGKTTTVNIIYHILKTAGKKVSMVSTLGATIDGETSPIGFHVTTPDSFGLQKILRKAVTNGSKYFVLEVTSHSLDQERVAGIPFKIGVLTNITNEHLDYHKTFDNYVKAKEKLLKRAEAAVVNRDDSSYSLLSESLNSKEANNWITYGLFASSEINPKSFNLKGIKIVGRFNEYNYLAAAAVARKLGISDVEIRKSLITFSLPKGRLDMVYKGKFGVMIDFAHTPNGFEQLLKTLRPVIKGRIIHVFGSAGERDSVKRPYLGQTSASYANIVIITAEDPRSEDVNKIIDQIASGIDNPKAEIIKIADRREAIFTSIQMAKENDLVLITGKAVEKSMNMGKGEESWDEYKVVNSVLSELKLI